MKKFMTFLMLMLSSIQGAYAMSVDEFIDKNIAPVTDYIAKLIFFPIKMCGIEIPAIILWILFALY